MSLAYKAETVPFRERVGGNSRSVLALTPSVASSVPEQVAATATVNGLDSMVRPAIDQTADTRLPSGSILLC